MIYILEDDASIRELVAYAVESQNMSISGFERPSAFWRAMEAQLPELVLLDVMLPEEDGLTVLKKLRTSAKWRSVPVIMLTARNTEFDRVMGLDGGADDFVSKPFGMMELLARIRAVLRRSDREQAQDTYQLGSISLSLSRREVTVDGVEVQLTFKEFELLLVLMANAGQVLSRNTLMERVWGGEFPRENRTLDVHIRTLRSKLGSAGEMISTVRGVGYRIGENA
ncbi:MAG: response regulator transcription factor [bacterium]|nr:response regulator transcription factor [bacterium]